MADDSVSQNARSRHQRYMRYLIGACVLGGLLAVVVSTTRIEGYMAATVARVLPITGDDVSQITYTATLPDGSTLTYTATQMQGEDFDAFAARAAREWEAVKAANGL